VCIIYLSNRFSRRLRKYCRIDFLKRYLINVHFNHMTKGVIINCTLYFCKIKDGFTDIKNFLHHIIIIHDYNLKIRLYRFQRYQSLSFINFPSIKDL
jgi:hypothetical protein